MEKNRTQINFNKKYIISATNNIIKIYLNKNSKIIFKEKYNFRIFKIKSLNNQIIIYGIIDIILLEINELINNTNYKINQYLGKINERITDVIFLNNEIICTTLYKLYKIKIKNNSILENIIIKEKYEGTTFCSKLFKFKKKLYIFRGTSNGKIFINDFEINLPELLNSIIYDLYFLSNKIGNELNGELIIATESRKLIVLRIINGKKIELINVLLNIKHRFLRCGYFSPKILYGISDFNTIYLLNNGIFYELFSPSKITSINYNKKNKQTIICTETKEYIYKEIKESYFGLNILMSKYTKYQEKNELIDLLNVYNKSSIKCIIKVGKIIFYSISNKIYFQSLININNDDIENNDIENNDIINDDIKFLNILCDNYILITTNSNKFYQLDIINRTIRFIYKEIGEVVCFNCGIICTKNNNLIIFPCKNSKTNFPIKKYKLPLTSQKIIQCKIINNKYFILFDKQMIIFEGKNFNKKQIINFKRNLKGFFFIKKKKDFNNLFVFGIENNKLFIQHLCTKAILYYKYFGYFSSSNYENNNLIIYDFIKQNKIKIIGFTNLFNNYFSKGNFEYYINNNSIIYENFNKEKIYSLEEFKIKKENKNILCVLNKFNKIIFKEEFNCEIYDFKNNKKILIVGLKNKELIFYKIKSNILFFNKKYKLNELIKSICLLNSKLILGFVTGHVYSTKLNNISFDEEKIKKSKIFYLSKLFKFKDFCIITTNNGFIELFEIKIKLKMHLNSINDLCVIDNKIYTVGDDYCISYVDLSPFFNYSSYDLTIKTILAHSGPIISICLNKDMFIETISIDGYKKKWTKDLKYLSSIYY